LSSKFTGTMPRLGPVSRERNGAKGRLSVIRTVKGVTTVTSLTGSRKLACGDFVFGSRMRSMVYFTSLASTVLPSWNVALRRRVKVYSRPSRDTVQLVARLGSICSVLGLRRSRLS